MSKARTLLLRGTTAIPALLALALPRSAHAQSDISPRLTNALLLVDSSGSMEYKTDGTVPVCNPASTASLNEKSRWIDVVEALTGTIDNYTCQAIDRADSSGAGFKTGEYALGGAPYDYLYSLAYHRPLSNGCAPAPGVQSSNPFIYPASGAIAYHKYSSTASCTFSQSGNDGVLDSYRNLVRFGLMTFDSSTGAGTGFGGSMASASADSTTGKAGLWSYVVGSAVQGGPGGCAKTDQEVGARNGAAPAWEGRMVNFGNPYDGVRAYQSKNDHIQEILRATRPYGATPIAGMLQDATDFLVKDTSKDPDRIPSTLSDSDVASDFGPYHDPFVGCAVNPRKQVVILLSDGAPNMDLRPYCTLGGTPAGVCPFQLPEKIAADLDTDGPTHKAIVTYVIGFALDKVDHDNNPATPVKDCNTITASDVASTSTSLCGNPANASNDALQACCTLQRIAIAGGATLPPDKQPPHAYFASDRAGLQGALHSILATTLDATSRTRPVASAGGGSGSTGGGGFQFINGFVPLAGEAWRGTLERVRIICDDDTNPMNAGVPTPQPINITKGDNFERNLAIGGPNSRRIYTVLGGATASDPLVPSSTIRPLFGTTDKDGVGTYSGHNFSGNSRYFIDNLPLNASAIPVASCFNEAGGALTAANCQKQYLEWWAGYANGQLGPTPRCPSTADCHLLGDIMHSTPLVVDRPLGAIRDESYARFAELQKLRPKVLYTSTNDGFLHAFKVASNDPADATDAAKKVLTNANNELWAFVPPAVLPNLYHLYPYNHQILLDGAATFQDVVAEAPVQADQPPTVFQRTRLAAQLGSAVWRTVLLQGFGSEHTGYFAVDVTNPVPDTTNPADTNKGGPRMLWQLTTDKAGGKLFGRGGGTPAIATLYFDPEGGATPREIPVAILPGGPGGSQVTSGTGCPSGGRTFSDVTLDTAYPPRAKVHCYDFTSDGDTGARSVTIVRLDTGEIIRTFRQSKTEVAVDLQPRVTEVGIDSPITGQPVAFPNLTGEVADRIFVGDQDGRFWRLNVASAKPADWTMKLFMDLYPSALASGPGKTFADGQPIVIPPVLSVDLENNLVLDVATGDQEALGPAPTMSTFVFSLMEKVNTTHTGYSTKVNWYKELTAGERVVGEMSLFNGSLFFGSFIPAPPSDVCDVGTSKIWGMNYLLPQTSTLSNGGQTVLGYSGQVIQNVPSAVAFGPSVQQQPSCSTDVDSLLGDGVLGFGHQVGLSNIRTGKFQLVFQTGNNKTGTTVSSASVGVKAIDLPTPPALSTVSAWASIVE